MQIKSQKTFINLRFSNIIILGDETAIVIANQHYASSKTCSLCGNIQEMKVDKRIYKCEKCGLILDRDLNAAINIANYININ